MSRRTKIILAIVALVVVAGAVAFFALGSQGGGPEIETATVNETQLAVTVTASGKVESGVSADVFPPTAGKIDEIYVSDGASVTAGEAIAQMDTGPLELQVAQAEAGLAQAKAALANSGATAAGTSADVAAAKANVDAAYAGYQAAKKSAANVSKQAPSASAIAAAEANTAAAKAAYDAAKAAYDAAVAASPNPSIDPTVTALGITKDQAYAAYMGAKATEESLKSTDLSAAQAQADAAVDQAYAGYKGALSQLQKAQAADPSSSKAAAVAAVAQAEEGLRLAEEALDDATLVAPIDGVVVFNGGGLAAAGGGGGKPTDGSAVSPQAAPFTVVDLGGLKFTAEVDEADIERVEVGMKVAVTLDSFPGETFKSTVVRISPQAQATATGGTIFPVEIALEDNAKDILIGMKGDAEIEVSSVGGALTIPIEALFSEGGTDFVYTVEANKLAKTEITVGATTDTEVEVLEGLKAGDVVALSGSTQYTDGMTVNTGAK